MDVGWRTQYQLPRASMRCIEYAAATLLCVLFFAMAWLIVRRALGAFVPSDSSAVLFCATIFLVLAAFAIRIPIWSSTAISRNLLLYGGTVAILGTAAILTDVRSQAAWAWLSLWGCAVAAEIWIYRASSAGARGDDGVVSSKALVGDTDAFDEEAVQRLVRTANPEVGEIVQATYRVQFSEGQRNESVHLAFCPPLSRVPDVEVEPVDGPDATAKVALAVPHGVRLDVRLDTPTEEPTEVVIEVFVQGKLP